MIPAYLRVQSLKLKLATNQVIKYQQLHATRADIQKLYQDNGKDTGKPLALQ